MPDLVIGGRRAGVARPWRAGVIVIAMIGVALVVAWFIYRRTVAYDVPPGDVHGEITWSPPTAGGAPGAGGAQVISPWTSPGGTS